MNKGAVLHEAVVALHPGRDAAALQQRAQQAGVALEPMFAGARDAEGSRWWLLHSADAQQLAAFITQLQGQADVEAAYLKPTGSAP